MSKDKSSQPASPYATTPFAAPAAHPATNPYGANPGGASLSGGVYTGATPDGSGANSTYGTNPNSAGTPGVNGGTITQSEAQSGQFAQNAVQLHGPTAALYGVPDGGYYYGPGVSGPQPGSGTGSSANAPAPSNPYATSGNPLAPASGSPTASPYSFPGGANPLGGSPSTGVPSTGAPSGPARPGVPPSSAPPMGSPSSAPAGQVAGGTAPPPPIPYGNVQNTLNTSNVPSLVGGDALAQQMQQAQQAAYKQATAYLDPQWANAQRDLETKLANQGIPVGSEAYTRATDEFNRNKAFAYSQAEQSAVQQGNTAQQQLYGEGLASNQNAFGQSLSGGQFSNSAEQQVAQQILANLGFNEQVNQNNFTDSMDTRRQDINELLLQQQNPLQMFQALTGGNNIGTPNFTNTPGTNVGGTDIASIIAQALQQGNNTYNTQVGSQNSQTSAYATILAALLSDRRFKRNVRMIGMHEVGVPLYTFDYVWGTPGIGVMADEVAKVRPHAVITLPNGVQAVNYAEFSEVA